MVNAPLQYVVRIKVLYIVGSARIFPCELLTQYSCDPEHGDTPHGARIEQCKRWYAELKGKK